MVPEAGSLPVPSEYKVSPGVRRRPRPHLPGAARPGSRSHTIGGGPASRPAPQRPRRQGDRRAPPAAAEGADPRGGAGRPRPPGGLGVVVSGGRDARRRARVAPWRSSGRRAPAGEGAGETRRAGPGSPELARRPPGPRRPRAPAVRARPGRGAGPTAEPGRERDPRGDPRSSGGPPRLASPAPPAPSPARLEIPVCTRELPGPGPAPLAGCRGDRAPGPGLPSRPLPAAAASACDPATQARGGTAGREASRGGALQGAGPWTAGFVALGSPAQRPREAGVTLLDSGENGGATRWSDWPQTSHLGDGCPAEPRAELTPNLDVIKPTSLETSGRQMAGISAPGSFLLGIFWAFWQEQEPSPVTGSFTRPEVEL
uniref:collagen alpha-1(I) chain-like n=1 Tax=Panthera onca TaxID=9690 RepID=UPI002953A51D|nr:collagen alpha-1(I) chain-like [Panthera onca]